MRLANLIQNNNDYYLVMAGDSDMNLGLADREIGFLTLFTFVQLKNSENVYPLLM